MRRRKFVALLGAAAGWPLTTTLLPAAQMQRVAVLMGLPASDQEGQRWVRRFIQELRDLGWRNGTNVQIDLRWTSDIHQTRTFAQELIDLKPDVIHVTTAIATAEVLRKTRAIPVVFSVVNDPVAVGFVQSRERPGGNATGFTNIDSALVNKWVELIKEIAPRVTRVAILFNPVPGSQFERRWPQIEAAVASHQMTAEAIAVGNLAEVEKALEALGRDPQAALIVVQDAFFNLARAGLVTSLVSRHRVIAVYPIRDFVMAGGLASYSVDIPDLERRAAGYVDRILKGEKPADLPVQGPTKYELAINTKAAKALGLTLPPSLIARANDVID